MSNQALQKQNQQVQTAKPRALEVMAARLNIEPGKMMATLKGTVFPTCTDDELAMMVLVCNEFQLNPFLREVYAFPKKGGGIVPVVGVDGWNRILLRQEQYDGIEFSFEDDEKGDVYSCTATVYVKGRSHPVKITEYFSECVRNTDPWKQMPRRMMRNKTLNQAARVAFGVAGIYDDDEAIDVASTVIPDTGSGSRLRALPAPDHAPTETETRPPANGGAKKSDPRVEMQEFLDANGLSFNILKVWGEETGNIENADSCADLSMVPSEVLTRLLSAKTGLLKSLQAAKESMVR